MSELNKNEKKEFWKADSELKTAYEKAGVKKIRMQLHIRLSEKIGLKTGDPNEHLHIHYYKYKDGDFRHLISDSAYKQKLKKILIF